jgi:hypothetical protein
VNDVELIRSDNSSTRRNYTLARDLHTIANQRREEAKLNIETEELNLNSYIEPHMINPLGVTPAFARHVPEQWQEAAEAKFERPSNQQSDENVRSIFNRGPVNPTNRQYRLDFNHENDSYGTHQDHAIQDSTPQNHSDSAYRSAMTYNYSNGGSLSDDISPNAQR